jgi:hypothetical protein
MDVINRISSGLWRLVGDNITEGDIQLKTNTPFRFRHLKTSYYLSVKNDGDKH